MKEKLAELNKLYLFGTEQQKKIIEQQIVDLFPKEQYPHSEKLEKLLEQQNNIVKEITSCTDKDRVISYIKQINNIQEQIKDYANDLQTYSRSNDTHKFLDSMLEQIKNEAK